MQIKWEIMSISKINVHFMLEVITFSANQKCLLHCHENYNFFIARMSDPDSSQSETPDKVIVLNSFVF